MSCGCVPFPGRCRTHDAKGTYVYPCGTFLRPRFLVLCKFLHDCCLCSLHCHIERAPVPCVLCVGTSLNQCLLFLLLCQLYCWLVSVAQELAGRYSRSLATWTCTACNQTAKYPARASVNCYPSPSPRRSSTRWRPPAGEHRGRYVFRGGPLAASTPCKGSFYTRFLGAAHPVTVLESLRDRCGRKQRPPRCRALRTRLLRSQN